MAEIITPFAPRSGAAAAAHFVARFATKAFAGVRRAIAEHRTTAMLRAFDARTCRTSVSAAARSGRSPVNTTRAIPHPGSLKHRGSRGPLRSEPP